MAMIPTKSRRLLSYVAMFCVIAGGVATPSFAYNEDPHGCIRYAKAQCGDSHGNIDYQCFEDRYYECMVFFGG